jgi:hypothetical protein
MSRDNKRAADDAEREKRKKIDAAIAGEKK